MHEASGIRNSFWSRLCVIETSVTGIYFVQIGSGQQNESPFKNTCEEKATSSAQMLLAGADIMTLCNLVVFDR